MRAIALRLFQRGDINTQQGALCSIITTLTGNFIDQMCLLPCSLASGSYRQQCADDIYVARSVAMLLPMRSSSSHLMPKRCLETAVAARASETRYELASVC